jgi:hypothetical protein
MTDPSISPVRQLELAREEIYRDWLGIKCTTPSHYGLLGLPELESDGAVILHAARRVKRKLRAYQIGPYRKQALDLLAEVGQAVAVLTSPDRKAAYDRDLSGRWRFVVEELHRTHCEGAPHEPAVLEAWLAACVSRGVPVTRLLPATVWRLGAHLKGWPPHGEHQAPLPVNLWIYRDAVILGQCLHIGSLERRVEAVKHVQKTLGISEGLARLVAEEVGRGLHLFARTRFVGQAKREPEVFLARLGRRVRRYGGHLGRQGTVLVAVGTLLGVPKRNLSQVFNRLAEPAAEVSAARKAAMATRKVGQGAQLAAYWFGHRPQVVMIGLALAAGIAALAVAILVVTGAWEPWAPAGAPPSASAGSPDSAPPDEKASPPAAAAPPVLVLPPSRPDASDLEGLEEFIKKYPVGEGPPKGAGESAPRAKRPPKTAPVTKEQKPATKFFNVPSVRRGEETGEPSPTKAAAPPPSPYENPNAPQAPQEPAAPSPPPPPEAPAPSEPSPAPEAPAAAPPSPPA